jgi:hypothetical protein
MKSQRSDDPPGHHQRYYERGTIPRSLSPGRVLAHNNVPHTINTPHGVDDFRCWTWLKSEVPSDFTPCECGWSGLPHLSLPAPKVANST